MGQMNVEAKEVGRFSIGRSEFIVYVRGGQKLPIVEHTNIDRQGADDFIKAFYTDPEVYKQYAENVNRILGEYVE